MEHFSWVTNWIPFFESPSSELVGVKTGDQDKNAHKEDESKDKLKNASSRRTLKKKLMKTLRKLKDMELQNCVFSPYSKIEFMADNVLYLIFDIGINCITFTEEEKREFGELLIDAFSLILLNIMYTTDSYKTRLHTSVVMKRSALQFILEDYADFPVGNSTVKSELQKTNITEIMNEFDQRVGIWRLCYDSSEGESDFEDAGASRVPSTHTWWFR